MSLVLDYEQPEAAIQHSIIDLQEHLAKPSRHLNLSLLLVSAPSDIF
jgi:hypothetical protein